jgi:subtilisin family serine protease
MPRALLIALVSLFLPSLYAAERPVGDTVARALETDGRVRVLIALGSPEPAHAEISAHVARTRAVQDAVLERRDPRGFRLLQRWDAIPALAAEIDAEELAVLALDPRVAAIDLDEGGEGSLVQSVPLIRGDLARARGLTGEGVVVAILDTGIDTVHPDLQSAIVGEQCFCTRANGTGCCPDGSTVQSGPGAGVDDHGHGTNVAGIVASRGVISPAGVAPAARLISVKVMDSANSFSSSSQVLSGLNWLLIERPDVRIVNMSLGTNARFPSLCDGSTSFTMAFASAINALAARHAVVFASSGNQGSSIDITAPACVDKTIAVGAVYDSNVGPSSAFCFDSTTAADQITCFSNSSPALDLLAPGAPITSSGRGSRTSTYYGTSQASPHAAGAAAILFQLMPDLTIEQLERALVSSGIHLVDSRNGLSFPRLDVDAAVQSLLAGPHRRLRPARPSH